MSKNYQNVNNLRVSEELLSFVNTELLKNLEISPETFWSGFDNVVHELAPKNKELIQIRKDLQKKIDEWHIKNKGNEIDIEEYKKFLKEIGYLRDEGPDFKIETTASSFAFKISWFFIAPDNSSADGRLSPIKFSSRKASALPIADV